MKKHDPASVRVTNLRRISLWVLAGILLAGPGCVRQQTYDKTRAEADELMRALDSTRDEIKDLDARIAELQAANRREDNLNTELRAAIRQAQDTLPILRERHEEKLAALRAQMALLSNEHRLVTREIADTKRANASLQAKAERYEQELENSRSLPPPLASIDTPPTPAQPEPVPALPSITPADPAGPPPQTAQTDPVPPKKPTTTPRPVTVEPDPVDESWTGMIMSWLTSLWNMLFN